MKCAEHCAELYQRGFTSSGVYRIAPSPKVWFEVWCDQETDGGGWTVIQRRLNGEVSFDRDWKTYKGDFYFLLTRGISFRHTFLVRETFIFSKILFRHTFRVNDWLKME